MGSNMSTYFITGSTGYIGSMLSKHLLENEPDNKIVASVRDIQKAKHRSRDISALTETDRLRLVQADLCDCNFPGYFCEEADHIDYILPCASVTDSREMISHPVEVIQSIVNGTQNVMELARRCKVKSMVYLSSMEVYGTLDCSDGRRASEEAAGSGRVELLSARSCYPLGKRMAENLCYGDFKEYGVPVKIARLSQTFGRGVPSTDNRVFSQFARAAKAGEDIVLHTEGNSMGNYCGIDDVVSGILTILKRGKDGEAYNIVNEENTMTIRQMAQLVASQAAEGRIRVYTEIPPDNRYGYAADTGLKLSGEKLMGLGWKPGKNLADMYREMLEDMR